MGLNVEEILTVLFLEVSAWANAELPITSIDKPNMHILENRLFIIIVLIG
jgi:hypothetical protein